MSSIRLISDSDINSPQIFDTINNLLKQNNRFIYVTLTKNIKDIRLLNKDFSTSVVSYNQTNDNSTANLFTVGELNRFLSLQIYEEKNYLSNADQKYVFTKIIEYVFKDDISSRQLYLNIKHDIFELFKFLQFYDVQEISATTIKNIKEDFSEFEYNLFVLYNLYDEAVKAIVKGIKEGTLPYILEKYKIKLFDKEISMDNFDTYIQKFRQKVKCLLQNVDFIVYDGFLFFDDYQKFILMSAKEQGKDIYLVAKFNMADKSTAVLYDKNYAILAKEMGLPLSMPVVEKEEFIVDSALSHLQFKFPEIDMRIEKKTKDLIKDGSIVTIEPFINREAELKYVVKSISHYLKHLNIADENMLNQVLQTDLVVVFSTNKESYEHRLSELFRDNGIFVFRGNESLVKIGFNNVDVSTINKIYYSKDEFLGTNIKSLNGIMITNDEKLKLFKGAFKRIDINKSPRPITTYPVAHYVMQLYKILTNGLSIDGFKLLLFSNWKHVIDKSSQRWDTLISSLKYIERYLEGKKDIKDWINEIEKLIVFKEELQDNILYKYHPVYNVSNENLLTILQILYTLNDLLNIIAKTSGNLEKHADVLQHYVMAADNILNISREDLEFEQVVVKRFYDAIGQIGSTSFIDSWDTAYFANNLQNLVKDWEKELLEEESDCFYLNTVNFLNMKKYKRCYLMTCESSQYPKRYTESFPFTKNVIEILKSEKYGITVIPASIVGLEYHLMIENYLFKNAIDFTTEKLIITLSENENGFKNQPSVYVEDIYTTFDEDIIYTKPEVQTDEYELPHSNRKIPEAKLKNRKFYTLTELGTYKLCPKLYFYMKHSAFKNQVAFFSRFQLRFYMEAVLYCDLFNRFKAYNKNFRKVYSTHDNEYYYVILGLFEDTCEENIKYFSFFSNYELKDIKESVLNKVVGFFCNNIIKSKETSSYFTIYDVPHSIYKGNDYDLVVEYDTSIRIKKPRISQNSLYTEFLVLKTGEKTEDIVHYAQMIEALDKNEEHCDRINLVMRIIGKINIQFDSVRFANDGIKRTNELTRQIREQNFRNIKPMKGKYCIYCKMNDVCKENYVYSREGETT